VAVGVAHTGPANSWSKQDRRKPPARYRSRQKPRRNAVCIGRAGGHAKRADCRGCSYGGLNGAGRIEAKYDQACGPPVGVLVGLETNTEWRRVRCFSADRNAHDARHTITPTPSLFFLFFLRDNRPAGRLRSATVPSLRVVFEGKASENSYQSRTRRRVL